MKAAQINEYGGPDKVVIAEVPQPTAGPGQVLIEVQAAALNPFDTMVRAGYVAAMIPSLPVTLGGDISGKVTQVGEGVEGYKVGDEVYGSANAVAGASGAFAQFAATAEDQLALKPQNASFEESAASVLVGVSALQAIVDHLNVQSGQKVLIHGGGGGIGSVAIQIAKHHGAYVATTVKADDADYVKSLGADQVIDYENEDFTSLVHDFDAVFDTTSGEVLEASLNTLKAGGTVVAMLGTVAPEVAAEKKVTVITQGTQVTTARLDSLRELIEADVVKVRIARIFSLDEAQAAFEARESGAAGKIVLAVRK